MNYYNELDPYAAQWLRNLIAKGLIPDGKVDERDIRKVKAKEVQGYIQAHFFAGIAGWSYVLKLAGWPEDEEVWTGSCPCQPFSIAGKGKGKKDKRHLWPVWRELIAECKPRCVFGEQVASPLGRDWLDGVRIDLEALGYEVGCADLCAAGVGAPHIRQRLFWVGVSDSERPQSRRKTGKALGYGSAVVAASGVGRLADRRSKGLAGRQKQPTWEEREASERGCDVGGLADTKCDAGESRRPAIESRKSVGTTQARPHAESGRRSDTGRLVNAAGKRTVKCKTSKPGSDGKDDGISGSASTRGCFGLGNTGDKGSRRNTRAVLGTETTRKGARKEARSKPDQLVSPGFWSNFDLVQCADGKARRIESGTFPLAFKLPRSVGQNKSWLEAMGFLAKAAEALTGARRNRVGRLKGYGNAIVPILAAEFIMAYLETRRTDQLKIGKGK